LSSSLTDPADPTQPIKILRVIARLNVGGPALHVAYLTAGLAERGYDTTLVAGTLTRGEESMAFVAQERGVRIETLGELHRDIAPLRDARAIVSLARLIRRERPTILHTHTARRERSGGSRRCSPAMRVLRSSCTPSTATSSVAISIRSRHLAFASSNASWPGSRRR
jgi:hypothetical protein